MFLLHSLKTRLALSHTLPILIFVPLLGVILLYQLERNYMLDNLAVELTAQGAIVASFLRDEEPVWQSPLLAQQVLAQVEERSSAQIQFIDARGRVLASNWFVNEPHMDASSEIAPDQPAVIGGLTDSAVVVQALQGRSTWTVDYSERLGRNVIDVAVPVVASRGQINGAIRLSHSLEEIQRRLTPIRNLVLGASAAGFLVSVVVGLILANSIARPLLKLTDAVARFSPLAGNKPVPEIGPTEIRTLAATYNRMSQRLHELEATRIDLLSGIVHELGRPLGAIKAAAQTIRNNDNPRIIAELAEGIDEHTDLLRHQLEDLILLGEVELRGPSIHKEEVEPAGIVAAQCRAFEGFAASKDIHLACVLEPEQITIQVDPKRLGQIVGNLLHNAIKYTPPGGQITVSSHITRGTRPQWVVEVKDNGPGIAVEDQDRIFDLFYRSPRHRRISQGMGIGLALARQLAVAHDGDISVQSTPGEGATFRLSLPVT